MGCEPQDLQRVLKRAEENPKTLRAVRASLEEGDECWRLVWGDFSSQTEAEESIQGVPVNLIRNGFEPHSIELQPEPSAEAEDRPQD